MPKFEYVSHQLACSEYSLDDALSLTAEEFLVCSHLSRILPHIPASEDTIYHPFGQMCCKCSFIAPSSSVVHLRAACWMTSYGILDT